MPLLDLSAGCSLVFMFNVVLLSRIQCYCYNKSLLKSLFSKLEITRAYLKWLKFFFLSSQRYLCYIPYWAVKRNFGLVTFLKLPTQLASVTCFWELISGWMFENKSCRHQWWYPPAQTCVTHRERKWKKTSSFCLILWFCCCWKINKNI